jgi:hypothetical protein
LGGVPVRVLDPTSQLMHTLSHSNPNGVRHLVDALYLISTGGAEIDWDAVCSQAVERRSIARTLASVEALVGLDPSAVPSDVTARLRATPRHWTDWSYQRRSMASREGPRIFATRLVQRSRGETVWGRLLIAALLIRHYVHAAVNGSGDGRED